MPGLSATIFLMSASVSTPGVTCSTSGGCEPSALVTTKSGTLSPGGTRLSVPPGGTPTASVVFASSVGASGGLPGIANDCSEGGGVEPGRAACTIFLTSAIVSTPGVTRSASGGSVPVGSVETKSGTLPSPSGAAGSAPGPSSPASMTVDFGLMP